MALGIYDTLCGRCSTRLGAHVASAVLNGGRRYYCPTRTNDESRWNFDSRLLFVDSGKKRSSFCDQRNNPGLYFAL